MVRHREGTFTEFRCSTTVCLLGLLGPRHTRPLKSPRLYGAPNSRFYHWKEEARLQALGTDPWEYLDDLFVANEAEYALDEEALDALATLPRPELADVLPPARSHRRVGRSPSRSKEQPGKSQPGKSADLA